MDSETSTRVSQLDPVLSQSGDLAMESEYDEMRPREEHEPEQEREIMMRLKRRISIPKRTEHEALILSQSTVWPENRFCYICQDVIERSKIINETISEKEFMESLRYAVPLVDSRDRALQGCQLCFLLLASRSRFRLSRYYRESGNILPTNEWVETCSNNSDEEHPFQVKLWKSTVSKESPKDISVWLSALGSVKITSTCPDIYPLHLIPTGSCTSSEDSLRLARHWLFDCLDAHFPCRELFVGKKEIPSRLLHIESLGPKTSVRIVTGDSFASCPDYFTLSHRWGDRRIIILERRSLEIFRIGIPWDSLPKTFVDAINLTRDLGFMYLWIDSLCIIQDSAEDWAGESTKMSSYYWNGICNIAAMGTADGSEGLHSIRNPLLSKPFKIKGRDGKELWVSQENGCPIQELYEPFDPFTKYHTNDGDTNADQNSFSKRGWIVQERILSPRTLYYGQTGLYWECRKGYSTERQPGLTTEGPDDYVTTSPPTNLKKSFWITLRPQNCFGDTFINQWARIVELYTRCLLTYEKDRLVAIAGIIQTVETRLRVRNHAGLWEHDLARNLLWYAMTPNLVNGSVHDYLFTERRTFALPTWSWASVHSPVEMRHNFDYSSPALKVTLNGDDLVEKFPYYSTPLTLQVALETPLSRVELSLVPYPTYQSSVEDKEGRVSYKLLEDGVPLPLCEFHPDFELHESHKLPLWAMVVCYWDSGSWEQGRNGLVITPMDAAKNVWARVGMFSIEDEPKSAPKGPLTVKPDPDLVALKTLVLM